MHIKQRVRWLHRCNATALLVLLPTGILHSFPDLRRTLTGDYELLIGDIHLWVGFGFIAVPLLALAGQQKALGAYWGYRWARDRSRPWQRFNMSASIAICVLQGAAGLLIWTDNHLPLPKAVLDGVFLVHQAGAWYLGLLLLPHLYMARRAVAMILRKWWRQALTAGRPGLVAID